MLILIIVSLLGAALGLSACSNRSSVEGTGSPRYPGNGPLPYGGGVYKVGNPYQIAGRTYHPRENTRYDETGIASWYGEQFHRRQTANGEWFDMTRLTAAHPTLPMPIYARVTNLENNRSLVVRINDRGPYAHDRIIDLSRAAAQELGFVRQGTARVRVQYVGLAPLDDDGTDLIAMNDHLRNGTLGEVQTASGDRIITGQARETRTAAAADHNPNETSRGTTNFASSAATQTRSDLITGTVTVDAPATLAAGADGERYYIQAASFSNRDNALRLLDRLQRIGTAAIDESAVGGQTYYRVRVGPLHDQSAADEALAHVRAAGHRDARIVTN